MQGLSSRRESEKGGGRNIKVEDSYYQGKADPHQGSYAASKDALLSEGNADDGDIFEDGKDGHGQVLKTAKNV